jgi:hypothetical protein
MRRDVYEPLQVEFSNYQQQSEFKFTKQQPTKNDKNSHSKPGRFFSGGKYKTVAEIKNFYKNISINFSKE